MNNVRNKKKLKFQSDLFIRNFCLWLLGIPINILPTIFKHINNVNGTFPPISKFMELTFSDFDVSFISISVLFVLCIEGCFVDEEVLPRYRGLQLGVTVYLVFLLILFCTFSLKPNIFSQLSDIHKIVYNGVIGGLTIIVGFVCNLCISKKAVESK